MQALSIQQLGEATDLRRHVIEQWISRGHFRPSNSTVSGKAREFTIEDAVVLGALAELTRIGMPPSMASEHAHRLYAFDDEDAFLVVTQGPVDLSHDGHGIIAAWDPTDPPVFRQIIRESRLGEIARLPNTRSMTVVNLTAIERRVHRVLEAA